MNRHCCSCLLLALVLLTASGKAQVADWKNVQTLPGGAKIKVQLKRGHTFGHCRFNGATDTELSCTTDGWAGYRRVFQRSNIKAIHRVHNGPLIGLGVGAGVGAALGASRSPIPGLGRGGTALFDGAILGGVGAFFGMVLDPFFHGKTVYRSPKNPLAISQKQTTAPDTNSDVQNAAPPNPKIPCLRDGTTLQCVDQGHPCRERL